MSSTYRDAGKSLWSAPSDENQTYSAKAHVEIASAKLFLQSVLILFEKDIGFPR
jgi:hypothetical protein